MKQPYHHLLSIITLVTQGYAWISLEHHFCHFRHSSFYDYQRIPLVYHFHFLSYWKKINKWMINRIPDRLQRSGGIMHQLVLPIFFFYGRFSKFQWDLVFYFIKIFAISWNTQQYYLYNSVFQTLADSHRIDSDRGSDEKFLLSL